jgi:hypothetical protein
MTQLLHAGLTVAEEDIQKFYVEVLGFKKEENFQLNEELADSIFQVKDAIDVQYMNKDDLTLELFIFPELKGNKDFRHLCLKMDDCGEIYKKAKEANYWTFRRTKSNNQSTYFIKDQMDNLFELKNN